MLIQQKYAGQRDDLHLGQDVMRFYPTIQSGVQLKTYELFISGIFYLIFSEHGRLKVTETMECKYADKGDFCKCLF